MLCLNLKLRPPFRSVAFLSFRFLPFRLDIYRNFFFSIWTNGVNKSIHVCAYAEFKTSTIRSRKHLLDGCTRFSVALIKLASKLIIHCRLILPLRVFGLSDHRWTGEFLFAMRQSQSGCIIAFALLRILSNVSWWYENLEFSGIYMRIHMHL